MVPRFGVYLTCSPPVTHVSGYHCDVMTSKNDTCREEERGYIVSRKLFLKTMTYAKQIEIQNGLTA
jgi:hypothetical protein